MQICFAFLLVVFLYTMKRDLSSQILLEYVSCKQYQPKDKVERSIVTRLEQLPVEIYESEKLVSIHISEEISSLIRERQSVNRLVVLALPGEIAFQSIYRELVRINKQEGLSFWNVVLFNLYEYFPLKRGLDGTFGVLKSFLIDCVDIPFDQIYTLNGKIRKENIFSHCQDYEKAIEKAGGIDFMLLKLTKEGNIGMNLYGSKPNSLTRFVVLDTTSKKEAADNVFKFIRQVPVGAITMGISTIMSAKKVCLSVFGEEKAKSLCSLIEQNPSDSMTACCLRNHSNIYFYSDMCAAKYLTRISQPWVVTSCKWDDKLIRRAIVHLCLKTKKPILKLTDKDYQDNFLEELLSIYHSAYNVNIRVFNDLQHTITGWPGGKPNIEDTNRPESALPYPKKIVLFSPHPDDDVISMGGTFRRLIDQDHNVYVAYQTSGNIAVNDEEVIRYVSLLEDVRKRYEENNFQIKEEYEKIIHFLLNKKGDINEIDSPDVLFIKSHIRRQEAISACRYMGLSRDRIHFLDLPFYETGIIKKNQISKRDILIIKKYLTEIQPDRIFIAADLADPHQTHKICFDLILQCFEELKKEKWFKSCKVWMYRGAWQEWEIDHIEMAVPISPEELKLKKNAILRHQSQMENAPFLGEDERLFWQRSEDRNRATADLYRRLGLADYEAIEAFVQYKLL